MLTNFPTELIVEIFDHVDHTDLINLSKVCKDFYTIVTNFSWNQLCAIKKLCMPTKIQFLNYFFYWTEYVSDSDIEAFFVDKLSYSKAFKTIVVTHMHK